LNYWFSGY